MKLTMIALALAAVLACGRVAAAELTLTGVMTGADHQTYREVPFRVPPGTTAVTVEFGYTGKDQKAVIDLGLRDPQRFRGWSGGNKTRFTVTETWATPSYLPGPLPAGEWKLILGVPNLRRGTEARYTAKITLDDGPVFHGFAAAPLKTGPGWYRGDLHLHTAHSDGSCDSAAGARVPCPLYRTAEAASARGLDFAAITEHNATSHHQALAELQPAFDELLLIPGREITTFQGHMNVWGVTAPLDFQLGSAWAPGLDAILSQVEAAKGVASINHPGLPSGEACMGCGWTAATDFARIHAVEIVNGTTVSGPLSGLGFWEARLNAGHRVTGVGGSDNHDPAARNPIGVPTTVVHAEALSQDAILAGLRAGRVFVDVQGTRDRVLDVTARSGGRSAVMGGVLTASGPIELVIHVEGSEGGRIALRSNLALPAMPETEAGPRLLIPLGKVRAKGWVRVDVVGPDGAPWLYGNPIYLRPE